MTALHKYIGIIITLLMLSACATLQPHFEEPDIKVSSFRLLPGNTVNPTFEIGLNISNPNDFALDVKGLSYSASIKGNQVFSGVTNQIPKIAGYGSENISLTGQADLFGGLSLVVDLLQQKNLDKPIEYELEVKISLGGVIFPIYVTKTGEILLPQNSRS
ncbi:LEA type 2 family protein [Glaciecola sp. MH2013]|uniref:LEA type 2 family protein n=1 Tax=Glaciecola sp. MH2013 TaxID=2785524 RepID=UPI00189C9D71|nr:LEA type 2 family protein [Glaciecola sp. MH2013]MBF7074250.1 LEA type 2 family protein [Glaciecola sp. MH2013]